MLAEYIQKSQFESLVADAARIHESLEIDALPRLGAMLYDASSVSDLLQIDLQFAQSDAHDASLLKLQFSGLLNLQCQRCLGELPWPVDLHCELFVLVDEAHKEGVDEAHAAGEDRTDSAPELFDAIIIEDKGLHLQTVIEDELIGSVPLAPVHGDQDACAEIGAAAQADLTKPFAGLADLYKQAGSNTDSRKPE
ncbi:MAG: YceD family protein [Gammaproteobacteria bacterium]